MASTINASNSGFGGIVSTGDSSGQLQLQTASTTAVTIDASQNVGIGVTPSAWVAGSPVIQYKYYGSLWNYGDGSFHMLQNAYYDGTNYKYLSTNYASSYFQGSGVHVWRYAASGSAGATFSFSESMRIDSSGNVGIGTTSPATKLESKGSGEVLRLTTTGDVTGAGTVYQRFNDVNGNAAFIGYGGGAASGFEINNSKSGPMLFTNNGAERMRIDSSGNLLVGLTSFSGTTAGAAGKISVQFSAGSYGLRIFTTVNGSSNPVQFTNYTGSEVGTINTTNTATTYNTSSDYRLKENVAPMVGALEKVSKLKPVTYTWKSEGSYGEGFIAHELQEIIPLAVTGNKDEVNEDGSIKTQGVDYSKIVATLTAAIQELKEIVDAQAERIKALEAK